MRHHRSEALGELSAHDLIDAARESTRVENAACARKLAVMAELFTRRTECKTAKEREQWFVDPDAALAAELAAALGVTRGLALHQTHRGVALRDRLPRLAALFAAGQISDLIVRKIIARTELITDHDTMTAVDTVLAEQVTRWRAMSEKATERAIDATVIAHDPAAQRHPSQHTDPRGLEFGSIGDPGGYTSIWARLTAAEAALVIDRIETLAHSVCDADPRTLAQRRIDAFAANGAGLHTLPCQCGTHDCTATTKAPTTPNTIVYAITDTTEPEADTAGDRAARSVDTTETAHDDAPIAAKRATDTRPTIESPDPHTPTPPSPGSEPAVPKMGFVFGAGVAPTPVLARLAEHARIRPITHPGRAPAEDHYIASRALADFIRCRDLTCRFPGCDHPATHTDIDHTVPYPLGPTHASNLKCLCRFHHLLKTFWCGPNGWHDRQHPDGTIIWTSPTGHTYTTHPGSRLLFPTLCRPTTTLWNGDPPYVEPTTDRGAMMPRRRNTRAHNKTRTITTQRRLNGDINHDTGPPF